METKFEFKVPGLEDFSPFRDKVKVKKAYDIQTVSSQFGYWSASLCYYQCYDKRSIFRLHIFITLDTAIQIDKELLKGVKFEFSNPQPTFTKMIPRWIYKHPDQPSFEFTFELLTFNFTMNCSVDASSLPPEYDPFNTSNDFYEEMFESGKFADVTITTSDRKKIKADSKILSRSKVFDAMINKHDTKESREKVIKIQDVGYDLMFELIRFIYCDKVPKLGEMAKDLLALGDRYEVPGLVNRCGFHLIENEDLESIADILIPADNMQITRLKQAAIHFAVKNRLKLLATEGWKKLKETHKALALEVTEMLFARK